MSTVEEPHPIISHLQIIEERLGNIEKALGIDNSPKPFMRKRTMALLIALSIFSLGFFFGLRYVFTTLFDALPT
jgi:hypothetical protein